VILEINVGIQLQLHKTAFPEIAAAMCVDYIQSDTKKRELLKNPTKIEEIQEK